MNNNENSNTDPRTHIIIKNARVHNLKNISLAIPRNRFIVITGLSGSGKSSLAYDTLYAEGQRRYVESLSSYARQFLGKMSKPEVDFISGIPPAIAMEQKVRTHNPRSTIGTSTEIFDYIKLLYARTGKTYSPVSGRLVSRETVDDVVNYILSLDDDSRAIICCPLHLKNDRSLKDQLELLIQQGFNRISVNGDIILIEEALEKKVKPKMMKDLHLVIDRVLVQKSGDSLRSRIADSVQTAFFEGGGTCTVKVENGEKNNRRDFSDRYELDGISFEEPTVNLFTFNNPYGACKTCEGFGSIMGIDEDLVIPNKSFSIYDDAVACWKGEKMGEWKEQLVMNAYKFDFPIHRPWYELTGAQKKVLWTGNKYFNGISNFFSFVEEQAFKIQYRVMLSRYRGKTACPECNGTRLRSDSAYVKVHGTSVQELLTTSVTDLLKFFSEIKLSKQENLTSSRLILEITNRLQFLADVGLGYLTLNRASNTLSGGESQRINLATALGSSLVGSMYILDEPSVGLHPRDTYRLIRVLKQLRNLGNTVIVVEHDEDIIKSADEIIDVGPLAGSGGGEIVFQGTYKNILSDKKTYTANYLSGKMSIPVPESRRKWTKSINVNGARENNLKSINVSFPLNVLTVVTGVSGSGKTSLVKKILFPAIKKAHGGFGEKTGKFDTLTGDINGITGIELVDQNPIGRSSRSNPATYIKAYDEIRSLFADQQLSKVRGYKPGFFSFNTEGGRCEECQGDGSVRIEMQFMADIVLKCESCGGRRFKEEVLDVEWKGENITDVLDQTVDEAMDFFLAKEGRTSYETRIHDKLKPLADVGLGYIKLGQSSSTLSGGEAQRLKLALFLSKGSIDSPTLFIFDEPTTGLHFHDIHKLYEAFRALILRGHSVLVIEHNVEIIKCADWVIDLGPEGGDSGGQLVFTGTPEDIVKVHDSHTGKFLAGKIGIIK